MPEKLKNADPRTETDQLSPSLPTLSSFHSIPPLAHLFIPPPFHITTMAALQHVKRVWTNFLSQGGYDAHALSGVSFTLFFLTSISLNWTRGGSIQTCNTSLPTDFTFSFTNSSSWSLPLRDPAFANLMSPLSTWYDLIPNTLIRT